MRNFHEWLTEQEQTGSVDAQTAQQSQPQTQQPVQPQTQQKYDGNTINIPPGQESMFANQMLNKIQSNDYDLKEEFQTIFTTAQTYLMRSQGKKSGELNKFFSKLLVPLKNTNIGKYLQDANNQMVQSREWDGTMPNFMLYDPSWASKSFKPIDPETWFQALSGLAANMGNITQGKTQSSVFRGG